MNPKYHTDNITDADIARIFEMSTCTVCKRKLSLCLCCCVICGQLEKYWDDYEPSYPLRPLEHKHRKRTQ